jgi:hypothetical protein
VLSLKIQKKIEIANIIIKNQQLKLKQLQLDSGIKFENAKELSFLNESVSTSDILNSNSSEAVLFASFRKSPKITLYKSSSLKEPSVSKPLKKSSKFLKNKKSEEQIRLENKGKRIFSRKKHFRFKKLDKVQRVAEKNKLKNKLKNKKKLSSVSYFIGDK